MAARPHLTVPLRVTTPLFTATRLELSSPSPRFRARRTMTWKLPLAVLPAASVAVQLTVLVPSEKVLPDGGLQVAVR